MKRELFVGTLLSPLCASVGLAGQGCERPNILVILADDLARCELSCYGGQNLRTPHIDKVADEGMRMLNNFGSMAMSVPIRASLYTGLYPARHGSYQNHKATYGNVRSVTHYMKDLGYRVGRAGKDHPAKQSNVYGFERIPGFTVNCVASRPPLSSADGILQFMKRDPGQPFCLFVCSIHSHMPWDAGDESEFDPSKVVLPPNAVDNQKTRSAFCRYLAEIRLFDNEVGMVMDALRESGEEDNTMVIVLSEQGPQMPFGKWTCYRYGQSSAMIVRYPGKVRAGTVSDALVQYEDLLPTMIEAAGGVPSKDLDGISQLAVLTGKQKEVRQWAYGMHNNIPEGSPYPIRSIQDKRYKLIENLTPETPYYEKHMMCQGDNMWQSWVENASANDRDRWLVERFVNRPAVELYDLQADPWELHNLASDPSHAKRISMMSGELHEWMRRQGDRGILMDTDTPEDPLLKTPLPIGTYRELDSLLRNDLNGNYYLSSDIEIPEGVEWIPIGASGPADTNPQRFSGILDGKGHTISGLTVREAYPFKGLFGRIDHATVRNLNLHGVDISGKAPTGGVTGAMIGSSTIEQVSVTGIVRSDTEAGGMAGRVARDSRHTDYNIIRNCYVNATVTTETGDEAASSNSPSCAGGLVGFIHSDRDGMVARLSIDHAYFSGKVSSRQAISRKGCAAGILCHSTGTTDIRLTDVLVLADSISAQSPQYFCIPCPAIDPYTCQAGHSGNLYVKDGTWLPDHGLAPCSWYKYLSLPDEAFRTKDFYVKQLYWDFDKVWSISDGDYPVLRK